jgi:hypothetical protein
MKRGPMKPKWNAEKQAWEHPFKGHPTDIDAIALIPHSDTGDPDCCGILTGPCEAPRCNECGERVPSHKVVESLAKVPA